MSVQRYNFVLAPGLTDWDASVEKSDAGTFVLYKDYAKLEAALRSIPNNYSEHMTSCICAWCEDRARLLGSTSETEGNHGS